MLRQLEGESKGVRVPRYLKAPSFDVETRSPCAADETAIQQASPLGVALRENAALSHIDLFAGGLKLGRFCNRRASI